MYVHVIQFVFLKAQLHGSDFGAKYLLADFNAQIWLVEKMTWNASIA